ncbi:MAG TPA: class I SAM-dependent methyltransferase [Gaiellaceae bacterium]|nr:class I SAM-dependent methyltransferase [Gaiellaceae bacterium]
MQEAEGARSFKAGDAAYDRFMGRYSAPLAVAFADAAGIASGQRALDVGCGPGALTAELVRRLGADSVAAVDPSEPFVEACRRRHPGVDVQLARAEDLPFPDDQFDAALSQLVLHFVSDPAATAAELKRVTVPGGTVAACVWDVQGMTMLRVFREAVAATDPGAPIGADPRAFGREGEIAELFTAAGLRDVTAGALDVESAYTDFEDYWTPFLTGIGPAGAYVVTLDAADRERLREEMLARLDSPTGAFALPARAWYAVGHA